MNDSLKISLLVLLIIISRFVLQIDYNEMDVLPSAYSVFNTSWLANDWYLSLRIPYRGLFGFIIGFFIDQAGFVPVLLLGRLVAYILFAYAYFKLLEITKVNFQIGCLTLMIFLYWFSDGAFYGEWMVGGMDTKAFSYVFVLLSLATFLKNELRSSVFFAGLALSFHILIGGYYLICLCTVSLVGPNIEGQFWKGLLKNVHYFLIGGAWGLFGVYAHLSGGVDDDLSAYGWKIYTQFRVPYHIMPKFAFRSLALPLAFASFNFAVIKLSKRDHLRLLSAFSLVAYAISLLGFLTYFMGEPNLLRFYFFRLNDALQPLLFLIILGSMLSSQIDFSGLFHRLTSAVLVISFVAFCFAYSDNVKRLVHPSYYTQKSILGQSAIDIDMTRWIKLNTAKESVFIVPMSMSNFYMEAERSMFVSWKHSPQSGSGLVEWYKRINLLNGGADLKVGNDFYPSSLDINYLKLTEQDVLSIRAKYPEISHVLLSKERSMQFQSIYETEQFVLYELP